MSPPSRPDASPAENAAENAAVKDRPAPSVDERARLDAALTAAEEKVARLRAEARELTAKIREEHAAGLRTRSSTTPRAAAAADTARRSALEDALTIARDEVDAARAAIEVFDATGGQRGVVAKNGKVTGILAVHLPPGTSRAARDRAIDEALADALTAAATELGVVLAAAPASFVRERPGRDAQGATLFEVAGRAEGDRLVPAVSRAAKSLRR
jgi:hypothetical protein